MSISETGGVISNRDSYGAAGIQTSTQSVPVHPQSSAAAHSMSLAYTSDGTAVYKSVSDASPRYVSTGEGSAGGSFVHDLGVNSGEPMKRKRGRPRKYTQGSSTPLNLVPLSAASPNPPVSAVAQPISAVAQPPSAVAQPPSAVTQPPSAVAQPLYSVAQPLPSAAQPPSTVNPLPPGTPSSPAKKARGRPPGSRSKPKTPSGSVGTGTGFTPHVITVSAGEDVSAKILSFSQQGPMAVCILSATGTISNVTLRQSATLGGTATYEGRFDILCLSGSFLPSDVGGQRSRTGGLSVSLAGQDGRLLGGCVAGLLTAASPVQVIVSSFNADGQKEAKPVNHMDHYSAPLNVSPLGAVAGANSPPSHGTVSESSGGQWPWQPTQS